MKKKGTWKSVKDIMNKQGDISKELEDIIANGAYPQYSYCAKALVNNKYHKNRLANFYMVTDVKGLITEALFPGFIEKRGFTYRNFYKDIEFMIAFLAANKKKILKFLSLKSEFEHHYLIGNYVDAEKALNSIYQITGLSFWYIEARMLLLNVMNYSEYCNFYLSIRNDCDDNMLKQYIRLLKRKIHLRTNQKDFIKFFHEHIGENESSNPTPDVWRIYFDFSSFEQSDLLNDIQKCSLSIVLHHLTIVDTFLLMKKTLLLLAATEPDKEPQELYEVFKSEFATDDEARGKQFNFLESLFCENDFAACQNECKNNLNTHAEHFEILDIYTKSILMTGEKPQSNTPLNTIINILVSCYIKQDDTNYASSYIDFCDRYLRAWNNFSGFYELLDVIINTMYPFREDLEPFYALKLLARPYISSEGVFIKENKSEYLENAKHLLGPLYSCDWGYFFYVKYKDEYNILTDCITQKLKTIRDNSSSFPNTCNISNKLSNIERILCQEQLTIMFARFVEEERYLDAVHLYMQAYYENMFFVTKLDIAALNEKLIESECIPLLADIDFFIYAYITDLNQNFPDEPSQCVIDSFAEILLSSHITKPSELIPELNSKSMEKDARYVMFFDICCEKMLEESPCDLYDEELYAEQMELLRFLFRATGEQKYRGRLEEIQKKYDYLQLRSQMDYCEDHENAAKINADWINIECGNDIVSAYDVLRQKSSKEISEDDNLFTEFKRILITCKREYVRKINWQMGTTIRHGVFDTEIEQLLRRHNLFIPECDKKERNEIIDSNKRILSYDPLMHNIIWSIMQVNCLNLFKEIEEIKTHIHFIDKKEVGKEKFTPVYLSDTEIREQLEQYSSIDTGAKFLHYIKTTLDRIMVPRVSQMREKIENELAEVLSSYLNKSIEDFKKRNLLLEQTKKLEEDFNATVHSIGEWFQIFHDSNQIFDLTGYLVKQDQRFSDIEFVYEKAPYTLKLSVISTIDIILINLIRNIELHSGFVSPSNAHAKITIQVINEKNTIAIEAHNRIGEDSISSVKSKIEDFKRIMLNTVNADPVLDESVADDTWHGDSHGRGLLRVWTMLKQNYQNASILPEVENENFHIKISFDNEGDSNESTTC